MNTGLSLGEFSGVLVAVGTLLAGVFTYSKYQSDAQTKANEGRVADLQKSVDAIREDADERAAELRRDFERQLGDVKAAMTQQAATIHRQEIMLADYARHVAKLERIMAGAQLQIPDFETSAFSGGSV